VKKTVLFYLFYLRQFSVSNIFITSLKPQYFQLSPKYSDCNAFAFVRLKL